MVVLGLTGSVAMGKSTLAKQCKALRALVFDADAYVHELLASDAWVIQQIEFAFSGVVKEGVVNRSQLGKQVFSDPDAMDDLEAILHPVVRDAEIQFLLRAQRNGVKIAVLDIPLLFETGADGLCDYTLVVTAPPMIQAQRMHKRGINNQRLKQILSRQMPDSEKRLRADFVIPTSMGKGYSFRMLQDIFRKIR